MRYVFKFDFFFLGEYLEGGLGSSGGLVVVGIGVVGGAAVGRRVGYGSERERCFVVGNEFGVG